MQCLNLGYYYLWKDFQYFQKFLKFYLEDFFRTKNFNFNAIILN